MAKYQIIDKATGEPVSEVRELVAFRVVRWALEVQQEKGLAAVSIAVVNDDEPSEAVVAVSMSNTRAELLTEAKALGIEIPPRSTKAQILAALED